MSSQLGAISFMILGESKFDEGNDAVFPLIDHVGGKKFLIWDS